MYKLTKLAIALMWPLSLLLANTPGDFVSYIIPLILVYYGFHLHKCGHKYKYLPFAAIPLFEPKLLLFPVFLAIGELTVYKNKKSTLFLLVSLVVAAISWSGFAGQTIFIKDYEAQQLVVRNQQLYPTTFTARLFHNKPRIVLDKFANNSFALIDPGNYFFGFAPRQIGVVNQNLDKYPFLSIVFFLVGLYFLKDFKYYKLVSRYYLAGIGSLALLTLFDKQDVVLWPAITTVILHGANMTSKKFPKFAKYFIPVFIVFAILEYLRIFIRWS